MAFGAGSIVSKLVLDFAGFASGFTHVQSLMSGFPAAVSSLMGNPLVGLAQIAERAMGAVKEAVAGVVESTHAVSVEAQRAGVSAGFLAQIGAAGRTVDSDIGEIAHSMAFLGRSAAEAAEAMEGFENKKAAAFRKGGAAEAAKVEEEGLQGQAKTFRDLGIAVTDAGGKIKPTERLFFEVADAIKALPTPAQQTKAAMDLLSRGGIDMVPILKKGSEGIKEIAAEMKRLSGGSPEGLRENSEKFHEAEIKIAAAMGGIKKAIAAPIIEAFAQNADGIVEAIGKIAGVLRTSFGGAVQAIAPAVGGVFKALGGLAELVGAVVTPVFKALQPVLELVGKTLGFIFDLVGKVLSGIGGAVRAVTDFVGITSSAPAAGTGAAGGGAGGPSGTSVNIEKVEVAAPDVNEATSQIAAKLKGPIERGVAEQHRKIEGAMRAQYALRSL